jgi:hypothetical protein
VKPVLSEEVKDKLEQISELHKLEDKTVWTRKTNKLTQEFIDNRFVVLRNFIPQEVIDMTLDSWKTIEKNDIWHDAIMGIEEDITYGAKEHEKFKSHGCHTFPPAVGFHRWLKNALTKVFELELVETYNYSRKYVRGAILKAHSDRPSCEISTTVCLDYRTDDNTPWKIWLNNEENWIYENDNQTTLYDRFQNVPRAERKKRSISVSLEPGDVLLYQGPNVIHWRDYLVGDYSYHIFCHFINYHSKMRSLRDYWVEDSKTHGYPILQYDGRKTRYESDDNANHKVSEWQKRVYNHTTNEEKANTVNNYKLD